MEDVRAMTALDSEPFRFCLSCLCQRVGADINLCCGRAGGRAGALAGDLHRAKQRRWRS